MKLSRWTLFLGTALALVASDADAQWRGDCSDPTPLAAGFAAGRSLAPVVEPSARAVPGGPGGSVGVDGALHLAGRLDVPIAGPWRGRVEVSGANWPVERSYYSDDFQLIGTDTVGAIEARQVVLSIGRQAGRKPACGYVLVGGGLYSLGFDRRGARRSGMSITAGMEVPIGGRGAIQLETQLHMISGSTGDPVVRLGALAPNITIGWSHRF